MKKIASISSTTLTNTSLFQNKVDFSLGTIYAVVNNCATARVLNNLSLFDSDLKEISDIEIVTIRDEDYHSVHAGVAKLS